MEGIFTVFLSFFIWALLPDSPSTAPFLTTEEREFIVLRLEQDTGSGRGKVTNNDKVSKKQVIAGLTDWKVWAAVVSYLSPRLGLQPCHTNLQKVHVLGY